jgi:mRNA-degrading endonuclease RelE of RelBE toxin-antitoxin system
MNKIEKLLRKISKKDGNDLLCAVRQIIDSDKDVKSVKIKNTDFFRVRHGQFRIIFHKDGDEIIIDSIRMRNDNTYKGL